MPPKDSQSTKDSRQTTLASFFGAPKKGLPKSSPASARSITRPQPSSDVFSSSPPASSLDTPPSDPITTPATSTKNRRREPIVLADSEEPGSPPQLQHKSNVVQARRSEPEQLSSPSKDAMALDDEPSPVVARRKKRKVIYAESDEDNDAPAPPTARRKARKSVKVESDDDEFVFDEADEAALVAAMDDIEEAVVSDVPSPASSHASSEPEVRSRTKPGSRKSIPKKLAASESSTSSRPGASARPKETSRTSSASNFLLTAAERKKIEAKEEKREKETCFDFLLSVRDKEGNLPEDPEYDPRTIYIPPRAWKDFTPFEKQFWEIKQNHYDTVLFFQKGKFYELYENDAMIGHQEFDLKLTDRVKMKMVGVPEQTFEFWAAKFLAAGYKVGKVEQAETAIGMEMRTKAASKPAGKEIVRRELAQVFTNGTIVDGTYLTSDEANHCVSIKEWSEGSMAPSSFGVCVLDASTGEFNLSAFEDDVCRTRLETMFRQIRPKELVFAKGNLSVSTTRLLRNILPANTLWQSFRPDKEFMSAEDTLSSLQTLFSAEDGQDVNELPAAITSMADKPLAMEALGGLIFYLRSLNLDEDLISQKNFNVYDPIKHGKSLVLDGQTLAHMEVLRNNEGGEDGSLLSLLQRCVTPFGKRLFRLWLTAPLRDSAAINERLDAVDDLMQSPTFTGQFTQLCKNLPDLERLVSRIHAGSIRQLDFIKVVENFEKLKRGVESLGQVSQSFQSASVGGLLRGAPDLSPFLDHLATLYTVEQDEKTITILPTPGADDECDKADEAVVDIENQLQDILKKAKRTLNVKEATYWHSVQGNKEIFQIQLPANTKVPRDWTKCGGTKNFARYTTPETQPVIREMQEARETQSIAKKSFFRRLLTEFDKDRTAWLKMVRVVAELDCLVSLAKASHDMDEPKCRPQFLDSEQAFVDFTDLRHPSMCLQRDFISNNVQLGGSSPRTTLLTGPNMAGKSTLLRMTAAAVIMAQLGCYVPASSAQLSPIDKIQTRMGAYDNMFASASTFKVELDECSKILREAGPRSLVILDELGRGTSTFDGMAIAGAVLHQLSTHTLPLGFFATHYGSLTDDFQYHPNIRNMHMQVHVDDDKGVIFLYKLIPGHAESSHGTHVAKLAGVPQPVIARADEVSAQFFAAFKDKLESRRQSSLSLLAQADFAWLVKLARGNAMESSSASIGQQLDAVARAARTSVL